MRFVVMIVLLLETRYACASQILNCDGRDKPGQVEIKIDAATNNTFAVTLTLTNPAFPHGITGKYVGTLDPQGHRLTGRGAIADLRPGQSRILISGDEKSVGLGLWADGDRRIESGFGVWFTCH